MPDEVLLEDLEKAFTSLIRYRGKSHGFAIDPRDFRQSLKELESNFLRITKTSYGLRVRFHNPSIKDFLVNFIEENDQYAEDLINSAVYFEQIVRLWGGSLEFGEPARTRQALKNMGHGLGKAICRLIDSDDCRLNEVRRIRGKLIISKERATLPLETRAIYALDIASHLRL